MAERRRSGSINIDNDHPFAARIADEIIENARRRMDIYPYHLNGLALSVVSDVIEKTKQRLNESNGRRRRYKIDEIIAMTKQCLRETNIGPSVSAIHYGQNSYVTSDDDVVNETLSDIKARLSARNYAYNLVSDANVVLQKADQETEIMIQRKLESGMPSDVTARYDHVIGSIKTSFLAEERIGDNCSAIMMYRSIQSGSEISVAYVTDEDDHHIMSKKSLQSCEILRSMFENGEQKILNDSHFVSEVKSESTVPEIKPIFIVPEVKPVFTIPEVKPEYTVSEVKTELAVAEVQKVPFLKKLRKRLKCALHGIIGSCVKPCVSIKHGVSEKAISKPPQST